MFRAPCSSGGGCMGVGGGCGVPPHMCTCTCMHTHACMHIYTLNMIISIANGSPHRGNPWEFPMMSHAHTRVCVRMHVHMCGGHPPTNPHPIQFQPTHPQLTPPLSTHPPTSQGAPGISQNSIALELIKIFQFCLKI